MKRETIYLLLMGLLLLVVFLVGVASEAVATATLPAARREDRSAPVVDRGSRRTRPSIAG